MSPHRGSSSLSADNGQTLEILPSTNATAAQSSRRTNGARASDTEPSPRSFNGFSEITSFVWSVADLLRGDYKQADYGKVILPLAVLRALANRLDNFELAMKPKVEGLMIDRMDQNQEIVNRYLNDPEFQTAAFKALMQRIYREIRRESERPAEP